MAMTRKQFNAFCKRQPHATHVVQWGGADVWKIGGKVFAIGGWQTEGNAFAVVFKVSAMGWEILRDTPGCRPAPYLASRGMQWIQRVTDEGLDDAGLKDYIVDSYRIVGSGLTKKLQRELGLIGPDR
jgi:predicted DNA-binding protein (MmcQ/YjbR family)